MKKVKDYLFPLSASKVIQTAVAVSRNLPRGTQISILKQGGKKSPSLPFVSTRSKVTLDGFVSLPT
jgi:hypothetical protein